MLQFILLITFILSQLLQNLKLLVVFCGKFIFGSTCYSVNVLIVLFVFVKGAPSGLTQFLATESPLKMVKNAFYIT